MKFKLPKDVIIKMDGNTVTLSRGIINYQQIDIDQQKSDPLLISTFKKLIKDQIIEVEESNKNVINDLSTLVSMGYLQKIISPINYSKILFIVNDNEINFYKSNINLNIDIISANTFSTNENFIKLFKIQDNNTVEKTMKKLTETFHMNKYDHIFWIDTYYHSKRIRIFNKFLKYLNISGTFAISDYSLFLITTVKHKETGCFECLENQMKTKLNNIDILNKNYLDNDYIPLSNQSLKFGFVISILEDLINQNTTNTLGNIIEFNNSTKEYYFDVNRIQTTCTVCATQNNVFHEEQNMKTINLLNSIRDKNYDYKK